MFKRIAYSSIVIIPCFALAFWPLESDEWDINWDEALTQGKEEYLKTAFTPARNAPNVLVIMVDDLSLADNSVYNDESPVHTPHMEAIADSGIIFTNAYVTHSICSPSRAAVLTGRYPQRFGFEHQMHDRYLRNRMEYFGFKFFVDSDPWIPQPPKPVPDEEAILRQGLPPNEITIAEVMQNAGYATGLMGKWHLGSADFNQPCAMGFDEFFGFNASHSLYAPEGTPGIVEQKIDDDWTDQYIWSGQRNGPHAISVNCEPVSENKYLTFRIAEESIEFLKRHRDERFFLMTTFNAPHTPLQAPEEYVGLFKDVEDPVKRVHYAMIKALDDAIGQITAYLGQSGLADSTLVFLLSDNGGAEYNRTTDNGRYRGGKVTDFEGGVKVPMVIKWSALPSGTSYTAPVSSMDIYSTILSAAGLTVPTDRVIDGIDLVTSIRDSSVAHDVLYWRKGYNSSIRDMRWKMRWSTEHNDTLMFDLQSDPFESNNVYGQFPEVHNALFARYASWASELPGPKWPALIDFYCEEDGSRYWFDN